MKKIKKYIFGTIVILSLGFIILPNNLINNRGEKNTTPRIDNESPLVEFSMNSNIKINTFMDNTFFITDTNSTKLIDYSGKILWEKANNISNPKTYQNGEFLVVASESEGKTINLFNKSGYLYSITADDSILKFSVNKKGYISFITKSIGGYDAYIYDSSGVEIVKKTMYDANLYPTDISLSDDGEIASISMINTSYLTIKSNIIFLYTNKERFSEYTNANGEFSAKDLDDEIVANIEFKENELFVFTDKGIKTYLYKNENFELLSEIEPDNYIGEFVFIGDKYFGISLNANKNNNSIYEAGTILIFDYNGKLVLEKHGERAITGLSPTENGLIVTENKYSYEIDMKGNILWEYTHNKDLNKTVYIGNKILSILNEDSKIISMY